MTKLGEWLTSGRSHDSGPLGELPATGETHQLLAHIIAHHPDHSQMLDALLGALRRHPALSSTYTHIDSAAAFLKFLTGDSQTISLDNKLFLLVHPSTRERRYSSIARIYKDSNHYLPFHQLEYLLGSYPGVIFELIHGQGYDFQEAQRLERIASVAWVGSRNNVDLNIGGHLVPPLTPRAGDGFTDITLLATLKLKGHTNTTPGFWPAGWTVFGLTNVNSIDRNSQRNLVAENTPLTRNQLLEQIKIYQTLISAYTETVRELSAPWLHRGLRDYQKAQRIEYISQQIIHLQGLIAKINNALIDPSIQLSPSDLDIQIWH